MWHKRAGLYKGIGMGGLILLCGWWVLPASAQQPMQRPPVPMINPAGIPARIGRPMPAPDAPNALSQEQKSAIVSSNFVRAKQDAAKLRKLADALEKEVDTTNRNLLSLHIIESANKIEKLARKIRNEAKDY